MKKIFVLAALTVASFTTFAQDKETKKLTFSIGVDAQLPMGDADVYGLGIGGSAMGAYSVSDDLAITLSAGYIGFKTKDPVIVGINPVTFAPVYGDFKISFIPVLAGIKYGFGEMFYGSAQLGVSISGGDADGSNFTYAPGVGVKFSNFDVLLKYTGMSTKGGGNFNTIGLRAAYNF